MSRSSQPKTVFIDVAFSSSEGGSLQNIVLIGLPVKESANGELINSDDVKKCFDDLIVRPLFRKSRSIRECNFEFLKIWLYDARILNEKERGYVIPQININRGDLAILSQNSYSKLKTIYVLDNELKEEIRQEWTKNCQKLFSISFNEFVTSSEKTQASRSSVVGRFLENLENSVDPYAREKKELTFDSLIIQID